MKIGIMGGTFDPIHLGHLIIAEDARTRLELDKVMFIPAGNPWMKSGHGITPPRHRVEMVKLAIQSNPFFSLVTIEVDRPGSTFTVDTLEQLWKDVGYESKLYLLMSWDSLKDMPNWKAPYRISKMATVVAFPRPGFNRPDIASMEDVIPGFSERNIMMEGPCIGISSTDIRDRVAEGKSIRYLVPDAVEKYITDNGLYKK
ncbi:MAG: nicotinate-nucleotide adenylyltransferase [Dehalococcoidia bacterium]|jgi:nicotinate-nucleotide adenylyltransferase